MPELPLCFYCSGPIKPEDDYVKVPPAAEELRGGFGQPQIDKYAHAKCHEQVAKALGAP